jgi:aarF domain-containing kinase
MSLRTCHYAALQACCGTLHAAPWLTKLAYAVIQGKLEERQDQLAREAVNNMEKLGPTFIKLGQILSIR